MPLYACRTCGKTGPTRTCPEHTAARRQSDRPTAAQRGYDSTWRRTRGRYLASHPNCEHAGCNSPATDVHHLDGLGPTGPNGHKDTNLQALCKTHHQQQTSRLQPPGTAVWRHTNTPPLIALLGAAGAGKSHTAAAIQAADPRWQHLTIDTYRANGTDWPGFLAALSHTTRPTLAESIAAPVKYQRFLHLRTATIVVVTCDEHERQRRLAQRSMRYPSARLYDDRDKAHFVIDTTDPTGTTQTIASLVRHVRGTA